MGVNIRADKLEELINTYGIEADESIKWDNEKKIKVLGDYFISLEPDKYSWATRYVQSLNTVMLCKHLKEELKNFDLNPTESDDYIAETKLNGFRCCQAETQLYCEDGTIRTIKEIVDNKLPVSVLSYNEKEDKVEFKKVTGWFNNGLKKRSEWVSLGRIGTKKLKVTKDHKIYTKNRGYVEAQDIRKDDILLLNIHGLNKTQEQLLIGSFLGDGNISTEKRSKLSCGEHRLIIVHQEKQKDYLDKKIECLNYFKGKLTEFTSGYGSHCFRHVFKPIRELYTFVEENYEPEVNPRKNYQRRKKLTSSLMEKLNWLGVAIWYMDDGHLLPNKELANVTNHWCRAEIATNKFNEEERKIIKNYFEKFGMQGSYIKSKGDTYVFNLNSESSQKFFQEIAPYIPESMEYKLPLEYRGKEKVEWWKDNQIVLKSTEITGVEVYTYQVKDKDSHSWECYDIEVEDNHNFFADNALIHNCIVSYSPETGFEMFSRNESTSNFLNGNFTNKYLFINKGIITEPKDYKGKFNYRFVLDGEVTVDKQIEGVGTNGVSVEDYIQSILGSNDERAKSFQKEECKLKFTAFDVLYFEKDPKVPAEWTPQYNYYEEEFSPQMVKWVEEHFAEYLRSGNFKQGGTRNKKLYQYLYSLRKTCKHDVRRLPFGKRRELRHKIVSFLQGKNIPIYEVDSEDTFKISFTENILREGGEGCFKGTTKVNMADGTMKSIREVKEGDEVLSYNLEKRCFENKKVKKVIFNGRKNIDNYISVSHGALQGGKVASKQNKYKRIICTKNHNFYNGIDYSPINSLDYCYEKSHEMDYYRTQALYGWILSDGYIDKNGIIHLSQKESSPFWQYTVDMFKEFTVHQHTRVQTSGKGSRIGHMHLDKEYCIPFVKYREDKVSLIKQMDAIAWAYFIMGDGSKNKTGLQLSTHSLSLECVHAIINRLNEIIGEKGKYSIRKDKRVKNFGYSIYVFAETTRKIKEKVGKYIPECMRYKFKEEIKEDLIKYPPVSECIKKVPIIKNSMDKYNFYKPYKTIGAWDLEIEDNHNYFVENVLVHNSILKNIHAPYISSLRSSRSHRAALKVKQSINSMLSDDMQVVGDFDVFITSANPPKSDRITDMIGALNCSIYIREEDGTIKEHEIASISGIPHEWKRELAEVDINIGKIGLNPKYKYKVIPINGLALTKGNLKFQHATLLTKGKLDFKPKNPTDCTWDRATLNDMVITRGE